MAVNETDISTLYKSLVADGIETINEQYDARRLLRDKYAEAVISTITTAMSLAVQSVGQDVINSKQADLIVEQTNTQEKQTLLVDEQVKTQAQDTAIKTYNAENTVVSQNEILQQQKLTEVQKTAQLTQVVSEATDKQPYNVANVEKQGVILDKQALKLVEDTDLVATQADSIEQQVIDNRQIKALEHIKEVFSSAMVGAMTVSSDMWTFLFSMAASLLDELENYQGTWDATTAFTHESPVEGDFYRVVVPDGATDLKDVDGTSGWVDGNIMYYDGAKWKKSNYTLPSDTTVTKAS